MSNMSFTKTIKHISFFKTYCIFIPGGQNHERINMADDRQLPSNHKRSFTRIFLYDQNIYNTLYSKKMISLIVNNATLKRYEAGLSN